MHESTAADLAARSCCFPGPTNPSPVLCRWNREELCRHAFMAELFALHVYIFILQSRGTASKDAFIERGRGGKFDIRNSLTQARYEIPAAIKGKRSLLSHADAAPQKRMQDCVRKMNATSDQRYSRQMTAIHRPMRLLRC